SLRTDSTSFPYATLFRSFLALPGERVDGHDFVTAALDAGAAAALVAREVDGATGAQIVVPPVDRRETNAMALAADTDGSGAAVLDRKSTRLNSSHVSISY